MPKSLEKCLTVVYLLDRFGLVFLDLTKPKLWYSVNSARFDSPLYYHGLFCRLWIVKPFLSYNILFLLFFNLLSFVQGKFDTYYLRLLTLAYVMLVSKLHRKYTQMYQSKIHLLIITNIFTVLLNSE